MQAAGLLELRLRVASGLQIAIGSWLVASKPTTLARRVAIG